MHDARVFRMVYYWLRIYVRVIPFAGLVCAAGAIYFAFSGESSDVRDWAGGAAGCLVGFVIGWLAIRVIENRRAAKILR